VLGVTGDLRDLLVLVVLDPRIVAYRIARGLEMGGQFMHRSVVRQLDMRTCSCIAESVLFTRCSFICYACGLLHFLSPGRVVLRDLPKWHKEPREGHEEPREGHR
jgi:hypothetical protein